MTRFLTILCLATILTAETIPVPVPTAVPDAQAFAVVVIPHLLGTLGRCEQIAELFAPGHVKAGDLAGQMGMMLGDPGLAKLGKGPVLIVVGPGGVSPSTAVIFPSAEPELHAGAMKKLALQTEVVGTLVVAGAKPADLALGKRIAASYPDLDALEIDGDVRIMMSPSRIVTAYQPMLAGFSQVMAGQMARQPNGAEMAAVLGLEIQGLLKVLAELETVQIDVELTADTIASRTVLAATAGSKLAGAFSAPLPATDPAPALRLGTEPGYMACTGRLNSQAFYGWVADLLTDLQQQPEGQKLISPEILSMTRDFGKALEGGFAMRVRSVEGNPLSMDFALGCKDGTALTAIYERMLGVLFGDNAIGKMYSNLGMSATLLKDVRKSGTATVNRIHYEIDPAKAPPEQVEQMKAMIHDVEYAIIPGLALGASRPADLDRQVQGGAGELLTKAVANIGPGRDGYFDIDYLGLMKVFMETMPAMKASPFAAAFGKVKLGDPTSMAWTMAEGRSYIETHIPLKPYAGLIAAMTGSAEAPPEF